MSEELEQVDDHVDDALSLLPEQFKGKESFAAFITAFVNVIQDAEEMLISLWQERWISSATGEQLDGLGQIVGELRGGLSDDDYRIRIRIRIRANYASGTSDDITDVFALLFEDTTPAIRMVEFFPAQLNVYVDEYVNVTPAVMAGILNEVRAAAVATQLIYLGAEEEGSFCFASGDATEYSTSQGFNGTGEDIDGWADITPTSSTYDVVDIASTPDGRIVVVVCDTGGIGYSLDYGFTWSGTDGIGGSTMRCITYHDGAFIVGDDGGNIWLLNDADLEDGLTNGNWTIKSSGPNAINYIAFANTKLVAVGAGSTVKYSSDGGVTWTSGTFGGSSSFLVRFAVNGSRIVAVGRSSTSMRYSDNEGATWSACTHPFAANDVTDVVYSASLGVFVAVGGGGVIASSSDGATFTVRSLPFFMASDYSTRVVWFNDKFVLGTSNGNFASSPDGTNWFQELVSFGGFTVYAMAYSADMLIVVGGSGACAAHDGVTWTYPSNPIVSGNDAITLIYTSVAFIATGDANPATGSILITEESGGAFADVLEA